MERIGFGLIDAQRGFMPTEVGAALGVAGFGELGVAEGEAIVPLVNRVMAEVTARGGYVFTTQDWHPAATAHFSATPNFTTTWPVHCVAETAGADFHPQLVFPTGTAHFRKGMDVLVRGEDDTSYSGYYATDANGARLPDVLRAQGVTTLYLAGLALDYCVGSTALDVVLHVGISVVVLLDATRPVAAETGAAMVERFGQMGVTVAQCADLLQPQGH
ncbi:MAG: isochorismatase family protein [Chloroflexi bacterium]|nr:isochorismatase family protein [Chloroflexota bacterium]